MRMTPSETPGAFTLTVPDVTAAFDYRVRAAGTESEAYTVTVVHPPKVQRIDVRYDYPKALNLPARVEEDGGDIYAPDGTQVRLDITADRPV